MDSVDDSIIATPADSSNLSTPESSSSEVSQPTVKLRANAMKEPYKYRNVTQDIMDKRKHSVDGHQPFLQTLGQEGRRLVETTGRTAQRARASMIRLGSRFDENLCNTDQSTRTNESYWPVICYEPRKCRSTTSVLSHDKNGNRRIKRRHYSYGMEPSRRSWETPEIPKRYSSGDYLRQQILEDLSSNELIGKTEEQIAEDRCNRVKAYLRRRNVDSPYIGPEDRLRELRDCWKSEGMEDTNDSIGAGYNVTRRNDLDRIRAYLQDKIRTKMNEDEQRSREMERTSAEYPNELSMQDIRRRYSDYRRIMKRDYPTRRVRSDVNINRPEVILSSESGHDDEKSTRPTFFRRKNERPKGNACRRTRSDVIPETVIDPEDGEVRKRFSSYSDRHRRSWQTKSCLTFEKKLSLPSKTFMNLDRDGEPTSPAALQYDREHDKDSNETRIRGVCSKNNEKHCRKTRSDTFPEKLVQTTGPERRAKRRSVSWSDKRKLHRRTSERLEDSADETSLDSDGNYMINARRAKSQKGNLCSWREYKERRQQERLLRESTNAAADEDIRKICVTPTAWRNLRGYPTNLDRPEVLVNTGTQEVSEYERISQEELHGKKYNSHDSTTPTTTTTTTTENITRTNEICNQNVRNIEDTTEDTETETIIQENYLLLERDELEHSKKASLCSPIISKLQVNEYRDPDILINYEFNMVDFGYDTIPKRRGNNEDALQDGWINYNANSRVKKTETFKIVDGSEDILDDECRKRTGMNNIDVSSGPLNETKSSLEMRAFIGRTKDTDINIGRYCVADYDSEISVSHPTADDDSVSRLNENIARDYFRRVYELLKQRRDEERRKTMGPLLAPVRHDADTSSSNYHENEEEVRRRRRRRKKDKPYQGEEIVAVSPGINGNDDWTVQKLLPNDDPGGNLIFRRSQLQNVTGHKRPRHPAPPIPANCKINAKDISKYFDYPNKENSSPSNGLNANKRLIDRNEPKEQPQRDKTIENEMGSNLSRHNGKGLTGRRTQSSGNLCDPKGKLNHVGKILVPCSSSQRERYKICGSLPNHLDDKEILSDEDPRENNNVISDTMVGNLGGTLPHKKRALGVHFSDDGPTGTLDLVKHRSQDSLEGDPWRYQDGADLDLVRCKHGNFDLVRKNQSTDGADGESSSRRYGTMSRPLDSKCHRGADLDLVGALPNRKTGESKGAVLRQSFEARKNRSVDRVDGDLLVKVMHKPNCELLKHRQLDRAVDLKLSRLIGGEPQDQGYASERSPEDEHPPSLPGQHFPNATPECTFRVNLQKSSRGLGLSVSGGGTAGPVRVKRLFPQQPAALSNKLQPGDILLAANGVPLTGLTNYEALEVLRTTPSTVELVVCRLPGDASITPPGAPPPPPARRELPPLRILNPLPLLQIEPCGEFDIEMTKVAGSLGFTLRKVDSSALGHYVRALVREPALSDGRIQPGDKIVAVDGATLSPMSHEEAVALLRQCGPRVKLRLYRDLAQTPVSALSPTEPDHPLRPPRTNLRQEAVDMLCDLAVRKLSPGTSNGSTPIQTSGTSGNSPRRLRRPPSRTQTAEDEHDNHLTFHPVNPSMAMSQTEGSETDRYSINTLPTNLQSETPANDIIDPPPLYDVYCDSSDSSKFAPRPSFLNLGAPPEKQQFQFSLESDTDYTGPTIVTESDSNLTGECDYVDHFVNKATLTSSDEQDNNLPSEPASMPPLLTTTRTTSGVFSYKNPAYQSANPTCGGIDNSAKNKAAHSSDQDIPGKVLGVEDPVGSKGLLKWKGVMFAPDDGIDETTRGKMITEDEPGDSTTESVQREAISEDDNEVFVVELTRGWNSRLGFSLQTEGNSTVISVVHPDSVAAKDGRLKQGDVLIMVNDESVENMPTAEIIDLLRKIRGSIGITVMRKNKMKIS